ncbi:MAG: hypothetical protein A3A58_01560 [Candidatus Blackburnbacteria bacterium RIFCSPLOWO2_01_FULL_41_27]|uniref:Uncharacterized protein n=2 Tax=Candidatus Blackburniibacteriota TaxID=1817898 RepID=A0A1G1VBS6_9BACT|nr:MAG: hypothetical protein A3F61_04535 [Candidatus Blackburnbacteria bacterium RIFCSPHIGHO2_12_FULL_41_13b]OGY14334.1 MAG: hypothetical protein A3A58_01560 [Candidatus Blackburnbacteria bacterium RIFCSPLOWO2_01_FULL_41_27]
MVCFLYHIDPWSGIPVNRSLADQILGYMFGFKQVIIDPTGEMQSSVMGFPLIFKSLEEAKAHSELANLKWVYFHAHSKKTLQEYQHPEDNVIYCIGSDWTGLGYSPEELDGDVLRVSAPDPDSDNGEREFHAASILPIIAYDRALKLWQRRHSHMI